MAKFLRKMWKLNFVHVVRPAGGWWTSTTVMFNATLFGMRSMRVVMSVDVGHPPEADMMGSNS